MTSIYVGAAVCRYARGLICTERAHTFSHFRSGSSIRDFAGTDAGASLRIVGAIVGGRDEGKQKRNSLHRGKNLLKKRESRKQDIYTIRYIIK